jgi:hypothetical protein
MDTIQLEGFLPPPVDHSKKNAAWPLELFLFFLGMVLELPGDGTSSGGPDNNKRDGRPKIIRAQYK